jgi:hypothetical protein
MNEAQQGELLRDEGMARALDHAERETFLWGMRATQLLRAYAKNHCRFPTEDVVKFAERTNFPLPPEPRAWGAIIRMAVKAGLLRPYGYTRSKNARAHCRPVQVWESNIYKEPQ